MKKWESFKQENKDTAGFRTQREAGFIAEVAQSVAMDKMQHVWIDGSLKDHGWFSKVFKKIREQYPLYRIAIIFVTAPWEVVVQREASRAAATGRKVPQTLLKDTFDKVEHSVNTLTPLADYIIKVENDTSPWLKSFHSQHKSEWSLLTNVFAVENKKFPVYLPPFGLVEMKSIPNIKGRKTSDFFKIDDVRTVRSMWLIPPSATFARFVYPCKKCKTYKAENEVTFDTIGGFVYYTENEKKKAIVGATMLVLEDDIVNTSHVMAFKERIELSMEAIENLNIQHFHNVTVPHMIPFANKFAFSPKLSSYGGFVYLNETNDTGFAFELTDLDMNSLKNFVSCETINYQ